jgi:Uri superfamily endonuclease
MACSSDRWVRVGKLGRLHLRPGFYVYVGSAFGPGGLKARIAHHMKISKTPHWHMDYLRPALTLKEIWFTYDSSRREHQWAGVLAGSRGATIPFSGFGASDCRCKSHLAFFDSRPSGACFRHRVHAVLDPHGKIFIKNRLTKQSE